ncbi:hypothetical protein MPNTM1_02525 [Mycolicibacterium parafortuitum]|uniref:hypothetical protein n=1 Tax=Mycolicibacterium parafortuitum TaxID=39692 RepID=UPI0032C40702
MGVQDDAAQIFADALSKRTGRVGMAYAMEPSVWVQGHEDAKMFFTVDGMGDLLVKFVRAGQRPVRVGFLPIAGGADALVDYLLEQIDDESGESPTVKR